MDYFDVKLPTGDASCSDKQCPCPGTVIPRGQGYLYIDEELVAFRRDARTIREMDEKLKRMKPVRRAVLVIADPDVYLPILMCEQGARLRGLDLDIAAADAKHMWKTGKVPLRPTPPAWRRGSSL